MDAKSVGSMRKAARRHSSVERRLVQGPAVRSQRSPNEAEEPPTFRYPVRMGLQGADVVVIMNDLLLSTIKVRYVPLVRPLAALEVISVTKW